MKTSVDYINKLINYNKMQVDRYLQDLRLIGSLSTLFSDSEIPLLHYRVTENMYCANFDAQNLARADVSADAKIHNKGIGIKTFIEGNQKTFQKVAEFNGQQELYSKLNGLEKIIKIAELRNNRLEFTKNAYGLTDLIYHCIVRNKNGFFLYEEKMAPINIDNLIVIDKERYIFKDNLDEYKFDVSKSTLYKRFNTNKYFASIKVDILNDPMVLLRKLIVNYNQETTSFPESTIIPLYSIKRDGKKFIPPKSGLNQWNAGGRVRNCNEVYIPFNVAIREMNENFFPLRDTPFEVELPNGQVMSMKICQADGKAIMSNPNKELGQWLLRDVLKIPVGKVITYEDLLAIGIDSVSFQKISPKIYKLDFRRVGEFEAFINKEYLNDIYD